MFVTRAILTTLLLLNVYAWLSFVAEEDENVGVTNAADRQLDDGARRLQDADPFTYSLHHSGVCPDDDDPTTDDAVETSDLTLAQCEAVLYEDFDMYDVLFNMNSDGDSALYVVATSKPYDAWAATTNTNGDGYTVTFGAYGAAPAADASAVDDANDAVTSATRVDPDKRDPTKIIHSNLYPIPAGAVDCDGNLKVEVEVTTGSNTWAKTDFEVLLVKGASGAVTTLTVDSDASGWTADATAGTSTASLSFKVPRFADNACIKYKSNNIHTGTWAATFYDDSDAADDTCKLHCSDAAPCYCESRDELNDVRHVFDIITSTGNTGSSAISLAYELLNMAGSLPLFLFIWVALPSSSYLVFSTYKYTNRHYADWWDSFSPNNDMLMTIIGVTFIYVVFYTFVLVLRSNSAYRDRAVSVVKGVFGEQGAARFRSIIDDSVAPTVAAPRAIEFRGHGHGHSKARSFNSAAASGEANL